MCSGFTYTVTLTSYTICCLLSCLCAPSLGDATPKGRERGITRRTGVAMVYCLLAQAPAPSSGPQVYYAQFYTLGGNDYDRAQRQALVASQVAAQFATCAAYCTPPAAAGQGMTPEEGVLRLRDPDQLLGPVPRVAVWRWTLQMLLCVVLEPDEGVPLAANVLGVLGRLLQEHHAGRLATASKTGGGAFANQPWLEVFGARLDETSLLLDTFLPHGTLLFLSAPYIRHLRKDVESVLCGK
eukprot:TRINITY_DN2033_c0_g1_i1.p1 TRINITY_DN2033_c0_g1~~TRINITY_DN2033_c0_g1_i1.p1  ORF type:complete len:240 (+),score=66.76 TRINITY_DN2033_c0_g1_i1:311-1030(+)